MRDCDWTPLNLLSLEGAILGFNLNPPETFHRVKLICLCPVKSRMCGTKAWESWDSLLSWLETRHIPHPLTGSHTEAWPVRLMCAWTCFTAPQKERVTQERLQS